MPENALQNSCLPACQRSNFFRRIYTRLLKIRGTPHEIALGLALGIFMGLSPFLGLHTLLAIFLAFILKGNKISAAIGSWIINPLTAPFLYSLNYFIGSHLMGLQHSYSWPRDEGLKTFLSLLSKTPEIIWALTLGGVVVGLPLAVTGYFLSFMVIQRYQEDIRQKIAATRAARTLKSNGGPTRCQKTKKRRSKKKR
jgi:uncharacterized protein